MNILVTGASGTVGYSAINQLIKQNSNINIIAFDLFSHKNKKKLKVFNQKITIIYGDVSNSTDLEQIPPKIDVAIHLAAIIPPLADEYPKLAEKVNVDGTKNLVNHLEKNSPNCMIIYASSISVYGDRIENPLIKTTDNYKPSVGDEYALTKISAEQIVRQSKLKWSIFRLTAIFGYNNHKAGKIMFHMPLETPIEFATPEDTGRAFANSIYKIDELNNKIFNLSGGEKCRISYRDFIEKSFKNAGLGKVIFPEKAFATINFHCGYYADGHILENILHFRKDTVENYFNQHKKSVNSFKKTITRIFSSIIQKYMLKKSEPYNALINNETNAIIRFFGENIPLNS